MAKRTRPPQQRCPECGDPFTPVRPHQIYDTPRCRFAAFKKRERKAIADEALRAHGVKP